MENSIEGYCIKCAVVIICFLMLTAGSCTIHRDYCKRKVVTENGISPLEARVMYND
jgi:hypothetical protein